MSFQLIDDWKSAWRWGSARLLALLILAPEIYEQAKGLGIEQYVSPAAFNHAMALLGILTLVSKVVRLQQAPAQ